MSPTLYCNRESGHSYKVKLFLEVARVPHAYEEIDLRLARPDQILFRRERR